MSISPLPVLSIAFLMGAVTLGSCTKGDEAEGSISSPPAAPSVSSVAGRGVANEPEPADDSGLCSIHEVVCGDSVSDCVDLSTSTQHCGACGRTCFSNQECVGGSCSGVGVISSQELARSLEAKDFVLINVRVPSPDVIPGTDASIPHDRLDLLKERIGPDRDRPVVLYCGTATRIRVALRLLREEGYRNISVLDNGITGWRQSGFPTVAG